MCKRTRTLQVSNKFKFQLILPTEYRGRAREGCYDQTGYLGKDMTLDTDRCYWSSTQDNVIFYINSSLRCLRRQSQPDIAPQVNIETIQPVELIHLDYLQNIPSKTNTENVLLFTVHLTRYAQAFPSKTQTTIATPKYLWNNFISHYGLLVKVISDQGHNFESEVIANLCQLAKSKGLGLVHIL